MAQRNRWFLLSLTLQVIAGALMLAIAFGHGMPLLSVLLPVLLLVASIALIWPAWQSVSTHREAQFEALRRYIDQRAEMADTTLPALTDPRMRELAQAVAALPVLKTSDRFDEDRNGILMHALNQELRTPINSMLGALGLLGESELDIKQKQLLDNARHSAQELWSTVRDVVDYAQLSAGTLTTDEVVFDPGALVEKVVGYWNSLARERGIELASFVDPGVPSRVRGDAERVEQVLMSLLRNAIASTRVGGAVISLRQVPVDGTLLFEVSDSGQGLSKAALKVWHDDLSGVDVAKVGHVDISLPLSRRLVELLGGKLEFDSRPGDGTRFQFALKLADGGAAPDVWTANREQLEGARCLLVDDNRSSLTAIREQLNAWHVNVDTVEDGARAVRVLQDAVQTNRPYDLAIVDLSLPDLDGTELANRIRAIKDFSTLTLISMVGDRDSGSSLGLHDKGFDAFLVKPVRQRSMAHWLSEALQRQRIQNAPQVARTSDLAPEGARLLLVEDSPANRMVASAMLEKAGYQVATAENGAIAVQRVRDEDWNLVLMDLQMPVMDGITATKEIRKLDGRRGQVPIVAVTANVFPDDLQACADAGMAEVVAKPIRRNDLLAAVSRWVRHDAAVQGVVDSAAISELIGRLGESGAARVLRVFLDESSRRIRRIGGFLGQPKNCRAEIDKLCQAATSFGVRGVADVCKALPAEPGAREIEGLQQALDKAHVALKGMLGDALT
ncbi:MAG: response regulator [Gammaproteobacteria bacterium]|nr:response regulator [Gammaproteobacteria bacterium]MCP5135758.1 response regulator [Gammaproteobacteria bacterium]